MNLGNAIPAEALRRALDDLNEGERVRLILDDGCERRAVARGNELLSEESGEPIEQGRVRRVLIDSTLGGAE
jgi:hypothetical protein